MNDIMDTHQRAMSALFPHAKRKHEDAKSQNIRFVHYTSAAVAKSIFDFQQVWMRQATTMNDFMEIDYGLNCITSAFEGSVGESFRNVMNGIFPGICDELVMYFNKWQPVFRLDTYLTCMSEHLSTEDHTGRLSMWRAYGGDTSVAIVLHNNPFLGVSNAIKAYTSPVAYLTKSEFEQEFDHVVKNIISERGFIASMDRDLLLNYLFQMLRFAALCTKHPGFHEEREWRIIYSPSYESSDRLIPDIQSVGGIPQKIFKIPLRNYPNEGLVGATPNELVSHLIIGPTQYPHAMKEAFIEIMNKAGVENPSSKIYVSDIPLRR